MGNEISRRTAGDRIIRKKLISIKEQKPQMVIDDQVVTMHELSTLSEKEEKDRAKTQRQLDDARQILEVLIEEQSRGNHSGMRFHLIETSYGSPSPFCAP